MVAVAANTSPAVGAAPLASAPTPLERGGASSGAAFFDTRGTENAEQWHENEERCSEKEDKWKVKEERQASQASEEGVASTARRCPWGVPPNERTVMAADGHATMEDAHGNQTPLHQDVRFHYAPPVIQVAP